MNSSRRRFLKGVGVSSGTLLSGRDLLASPESSGEGAKPRKELVATMELRGVSASPTTAQKVPKATDTAGTNLRMAANFGPGQVIWIICEPQLGFAGRLAGRELARGLRSLGLVREPIQVTLPQPQPDTADYVFVLKVEKEGFAHPEGYDIAQPRATRRTVQVEMRGATPQAVLYAVFDFLERQGVFFGMDGAVYPLEPATALKLPLPNQSWRGQPRFSVRGLAKYPAFLNDIAVYNREDYRAFFEAMLRMRLNTLGLHIYAQQHPTETHWLPQVQPYLSFEYAAIGHSVFPSTTASYRWGYLPQRTSQFGLGAADFYDGEVFGSEASTRGRDYWETQALTQKLLNEAFRYGQQLGIRVGLGFDPFAMPDEIFAAAPPEAYYAKKLAGDDPTRMEPRLDPESVAARDILEARLGKLLEAYPTVDYVWLWDEAEMSRWATDEPNIPLTLTPFKQAHSFLKRHAPGKRMVISGWGGVLRHFKALHQGLPEDIIFTCLNAGVGWERVSEEFARLEGRERWPIPWLEDDPAMWLPQFHVHRLAEDMDRAEKFGCQGLLATYWRNRTTEATAGYFSRSAWDKTLRPPEYFRAFAASHIRAPRSERLAQVLEDVDRGRRLLGCPRKEKDGTERLVAYAGDYCEAFEFWRKEDEPSKQEKETTAQVARALRELVEACSSPAERERIRYVADHVQMLLPYADAWSVATQLHQLLQQASGLKKKAKAEEARRLVLGQGVPLWLKLAPLVRETLLTFQRMASTCDDLGTLASMHNKFERLALFRLRASLKEFLGELPAEVERAFAEARLPDAETKARLIVPTRPSLLPDGEKVRIAAIALGRGKPVDVKIFSRNGETEAWTETRMVLVARRTFAADLAAPSSASALLDYYVQAEFEEPPPSKGLKLAYWSKCTAPLEAPNRYYTITLL